MPIRLGELASRHDCELRGDADVQIERVASLASADSRALTFLSSPAFKRQLRATAAAAVILRASDADDCPTACLINDNPYAVYARIATELYPPPAIRPGVHEFAAIAETARIAGSAEVSAFAAVGERSVIGENVYLGPGCFVGPDCIIGDNSRLLANVCVVRQVELGERCIVHPGAVVGSDGFGNAMTPEGWVKVPQLGGVRIGNDVEIGANTTIDCGALGDTVIDNGVRIDNLVQIAHNCRIGEHSAIAAQTGFAGSAVVGKRCMFGGQCGIVGHIEICDDVIVNGKSVISKNISNPGTYSSAFTAEPAREWGQRLARFKRLDKLIARVKKLEKGSQ